MYSSYRHKMSCKNEIILWKMSCKKWVSRKFVFTFWMARLLYI
jgi:hypothetical protein